MASNMFSSLSIEDEEMKMIGGSLTCEGRSCGVMTPEFCECPEAEKFRKEQRERVQEQRERVQEQASAMQEQASAVQEQPSGVQEQANAVQEQPSGVQEPKKMMYRYIDLQAKNPGLGGALLAEASKMFPNPEGSKHPSPFRVSFQHGLGYRITAYATTTEAADEMLKKFNTSVQLYVAPRDTYANVTNVKAETIDNFFGDRDTKFLGPYIFALEETDDGLFIKMSRKKISMLAFPTAEMEFWNIYHFFTLMNKTTDDVHVLNVLRKISPDIDASVMERRAAMKKQRENSTDRVAFGADGARASRPATLADFLSNFQIAPAKGDKKGKK
jgi:hypothetical protein